MSLRFRVWMPLLAVLLVLLSIATLLIYVLPAARARLANFVEDQTLGRAVAAAGSVAGVEGQELQRKLDLAAETGDGQVLVVDREGNVVAQAGPERLSPPPENLLQRVANGERINEVIGEQRVAAVPLVRGGRSFSRTTRSAASRHRNGGGTGGLARPGAGARGPDAGELPGWIAVGRSGRAVREA